MSLTAYNPFWDELYTPIDENFFRQVASKFPKQIQKAVKRSGEDAALTPPIDVYDNEKNYAITVDIPGATPDSINVHYDPDTNELNVSSEIKKEHNEDNKRENLKVSERWVGRLERTVKLPSDSGIDSDNITADYNNGVLKVLVPKKTKQSKQKIAISVKGGKN